MARPKKDGLLYFPFDTDFFYADKRIKALFSRYGGDGMMFYLFLLTEIYREKGYYIVWNDESEDDVISTLHLSEGLIKQVMTFLVNRSLLTSILVGPDTILTSPGIQKRYQGAVKGLKRDIFVNDDIWLLSKDETEPFIKFIQKVVKSKKYGDKSGENEIKSGENDIKEMRGNKKKEKEITIYFSDSPKLNASFCSFVAMRKEMKAPMTEHAVELAINKLSKLADTDQIKIEVIEQSIMNGWKGLFPLKNNAGRKDESKYKNSFNQFSQNDYDFDQLEDDILSN